MADGEQSATPTGTPQTQAVPPSGTPASSAGGEFPKLVLTFALVGFVLYFFMIRPESKQRKERKALLEALKKNDQVLTIGGLYGSVVAVNGDTVTLKVDDGKDVRIKVARGAIQTVVKQAKADGEKAGG